MESNRLRRKTKRDWNREVVEAPIEFKQLLIYCCEPAVYRRTNPGRGADRSRAFSCIMEVKEYAWARPEVQYQAARVCDARALAPAKASRRQGVRSE